MNFEYFEKLGLAFISTSSYHKKHAKVVKRLLFLSRIKIINKFPPIILWIQIKIAKKIGGLEWAIQEGEKMIVPLHAKLSQTSDVEQKKEIVKEIQTLRIQIKIHEHLIKEYKWIMDGIGWRFFKFKRTKIRILSENWSSGRLDFRNKGFQSVLDVAIELALTKWKRLIINDLTHYFRIGDIISENKNGSFEIIEVKHSWQPDNPRMERQKARAENVKNILNRGIIQTNKGIILMENLDIKVKHYMKEVLKLIYISKKNYVASKQMDEVLYVVVKNYAKAAEDTKNKSSEQIFLDKLKGKKYENPQKDMVIRHESFDYFHEKDGEFIRNVAPYTIFPFPVEVITDLLSASLLITTWINITKLKEKFQNKGWEVEIQDMEEQHKQNQKVKKSGKFRSGGIYEHSLEERLLKIVKQGYGVTIPFSLVIRISYEFLNFETLIDMAELRFTNRHISLSRHPSIIGATLELTDEKSIWR